ncbi:penicillin-binding protein 2 [bacterium]|nr:penicillin-binding protein 2 [candidate division CSSED10-310 bacterium]
MATEIIRRRIVWLTAVMIAFFAVLLLKLWWLQVVDVQTYRDLARNNRTRHIRDRAQRGRIMDRCGRPLATSRPSFSVYMIPEDCPRTLRSDVLHLTALLLEQPVEEVKTRYNRRRTASFIPRKIAGDVSFETVISIETRKHDLPGIAIMAENIRSYPHGQTLCHLMGYVGEISQTQLKSNGSNRYRPGDIIGKTGVEYIFEDILNGTDGERWVEVDSTGRIKRTLKSPAQVLPVPGHEINLTIDLDLQKAVESAFDPWNGAVIVLDPRNGEILAMMSSPAYDPNWFASGLSEQQWDDLNQNPHHPLINRCIQVAQSPGSIFKIITAVAGLRSGVIDSSSRYYCNGVLRMYNTDFDCWKKSGHGMVNLEAALTESCNVFFYHAGLKAGIDSIAQTARDFGLGTITGIHLPNELTGFIPDRSWKRNVKNEIWWPGETISVSIGQGALEVTPIQLVNLIAAVANRGTVYAPRIIAGIHPDIPDETEYLECRVLHRVKLPDSSWEILHEGLSGVVSSEHGTARGLKMKEITIACKTGTAQTISKSALVKLGFIEEIPVQYRDHNWLVGFGPVEDPRVAVMIFLEHGGKEGAVEKTAIAKKIFISWLELMSSSRMATDNPEVEILKDPDP